MKKGLCLAGGRCKRSRAYWGIKNINEIKKALVIPSVNLENGAVVCFTSCNFRNYISDKTIFINDIEIGKAVRASCSYPVVFAPCTYKDKKLVDGGIRENVPWKEVKAMGAEQVLSIMFEEKSNNLQANNLVEIAEKSISLIGRELSNYEMEGEQEILRIKSQKVGLLDMSKIDELYKLGYEQTKEYIKNNM